MVHRREIGPRLDHLPRLGLFVRHLSLGEGEAGSLASPELLDQDVFTPYKATHRAGLRLSDQLRYRPTLDSELWVSALLATNEELDPTDPDFFSLRAGYEQLWGSLRFGAEGRLAHFFDDDDRRRALDRSAIVLSAIWEGGAPPLRRGGSPAWTQAGRFDAGIRLRIDDDGEVSGSFSISFHLDHGRTFHDFPPGRDFENLRERRRALQSETRRADARRAEERLAGQDRLAQRSP